MRVLIVGHRGWLAQALIRQFKKQGHGIVVPDVRLATANDCKALIATHGASVDRVVCCLGRTHGLTMGSIDYLEDKPEVNLRDNCKLPLALALACIATNLHFTYLGTGCIFMSTPNDPPMTTDASPTFHGSAYSRVKGVVDELMHMEPLASHVLNVRIRMPFVGGAVSPRNFHSKVYAYRNSLASVPNSVTDTDTLFPLLVQDILRERVGTVNLTNPGFVTHEQVLDAVGAQMGSRIPRTLVPQKQVEDGLMSARSNTILESSYPMAPSAEEAVYAFCMRTPAV